MERALLAVKDLLVVLVTLVVLDTQAAKVLSVVKVLLDLEVA